jgi:lipopolysaccharide export system protein LptA
LGWISSPRFVKALGRLALLLPLLAIGTSLPPSLPPSLAQPTNTALTIRADVQEANSITGIVTAKGNVRMDYPARQIVATAAQAQYFSKEQRIILSGNVVIVQQGVNTIKAETITYLVDRGQFVALPPADQQVESVYVVPDRGATTTPATSATSVRQIKPAFKNTVSPPTPTKKPQESETGSSSGDRSDKPSTDNREQNATPDRQNKPE